MANLIALGAPGVVVQAARAEASGTSSVYDVWADNMQSFEVFIDLATSWDWLGGGMEAPTRAGIRASEIESALRMTGIRGSRRAEVYRDVRIMERAAIEVLRA